MLIDRDSFSRDLRDRRYFADEGLLTAVRLAMGLGRPLLLEGEPGVGKTQVAHVLAEVLGREFVRLQCYEGIDVSQALYEWDYPKQLLSLRSAEAGGASAGDLYTPEFVLERPLLRSLRSAAGAVLLIDEIDRADSEFEAFLLEYLDGFQISIPEMGTVSAAVPPVVVLTSNRTRELHDALKRRCLYHWIPFPEPERERMIVEAQAPGLSARSAAQLVRSVNIIRSLGPMKRPGIAETIAWAQGSLALADEGVDWADAQRASLGLVLKNEEDGALIAAHASEVFADDGR
ncbi:MoxR family ATPase [Spirillospora sp. NPDC047418]